MEVLWLSHLVPYPPKAGVLSRSYNLLREVSKYHNVHLVSFVQRSWFQTFYRDVQLGLVDAREHLGKFCTVHDFVPIDVERLGAAGKWWLAARSVVAPGGYTVRWLHSANMRKALARLSSRSEFDIIHFDTISLASYRSEFPAAAATLGHHNIESHMLERRAASDTNPLRRAYFRREAHRLRIYEGRVASEFDCHITCSPLDSERLREIVPGLNVADVPNGVDLDYFQPGRVQPVAHDLVFVGTMDWYPNIAAVQFLLDEVWPIVQKRRPGTTLAIVGSRPSMALRERAEIDPNLNVYGYVDDVRPFLEGAKVFVCPIRDGGGTKLKILDAMAMQCCILAHPVACEGIDVVDRDSVWLARSACEFADSIEELIVAPEQRGLLGQRARTVAEEKFSYRALGEQLASIWERSAVLHRERHQAH